MRKIIILLLCCGVLVSMVGCGGNTAPPPTEEIIIPPKPSADIVAQKVAEYINKFRNEQGDVTATVIPGLTEYCKYRCTQLKTNFAHDTADQRAAAEVLQYGEYVDW